MKITQIWSFKQKQIRSIPGSGLTTETKDNHRRDRSEFYAQYKAGSDLCKISSHRFIKLSSHHSQDTSKTENPHSNNQTLRLRWKEGKLGSGTHKEDSGSLKNRQQHVWIGHGTSSRMRHPYHRVTEPSQCYGTSSTGLRYLQPDLVPSAGHEYSRNRSRYPQHQTAANTIRAATLKDQDWAAKTRTELRPHRFRSLHAEAVTRESQ